MSLFEGAPREGRQATEDSKRSCSMVKIASVHPSIVAARKLEYDCPPFPMKRRKTGIDCPGPMFHFFSLL